MMSIGEEGANLEQVTVTDYFLEVTVTKLPATFLKAENFNMQNSTTQSWIQLNLKNKLLKIKQIGGGGIVVQSCKHRLAPTRLPLHDASAIGRTAWA